MDFYFYKHTLSFQYVLLELNDNVDIVDIVDDDKFTNMPIYIINDFKFPINKKDYNNIDKILYEEDVEEDKEEKHPIFVNNINEIVYEENEEKYPIFVNNINEYNSHQSCNNYPEFVNNINKLENIKICNCHNHPTFVHETYENIDDILEYNPNEGYYNYNDYNESEKLYGDYDDWEDYIDSIYN